MEKLPHLARPLTLLAVFAAPLLASAQTGINLAPISTYSTGIINFINGILVPVLMAIAFIVFLWGVYKYFILGATDETSRKDGRQFTLWGVIGFVIILSLWGLVYLTMNVLGLSIMGAPPPPTIWGTSSGVTNNTTGYSVLPQAGQQNSFGGGAVAPTQQQQAQQAYDICRANGNSDADCLPAYAAYGGTGTPVEVGGNTNSGGCVTAGDPCGSGGTCYPNDEDGGLYCAEGNTSSSQPVAGCMDRFADNYNPSATFDDESCTYNAI